MCVSPHDATEENQQRQGKGDEREEGYKLTLVPTATSASTPGKRKRLEYIFFLKERGCENVKSDTLDSLVYYAAVPQWA